MTYLPFIIVIVTVLVTFYLLRHSIKTLRDEHARAPWIPLLNESIESCKEQARLIELVKEVHAQFTTDSGLSMRDAVNRLDEAAKQQFEAAEFLKAGVREDRHKAELDREQLQRLLVELNRLTIKVESNVATLNRVEVAAAGVAQDLSDAHRRADEVGPGEHGAAADAASRQTQREKDNG